MRALKQAPALRPLHLIADLPLPVVETLTRRDYAALVARCAADRYALLPEIVSLHTRKELAAIEGFGPATVKLVEKWLRRQGRRLRRTHESIDAVICGFGVRRLEAVRRQLALEFDLPPRD